MFVSDHNDDQLLANLCWIACEVPNGPLMASEAVTQFGPRHPVTNTHQRRYSAGPQLERRYRTWAAGQTPGLQTLDRIDG